MRPPLLHVLLLVLASLLPAGWGWAREPTRAELREVERLALAFADGNFEVLAGWLAPPLREDRWSQEGFRAVFGDLTRQGGRVVRVQAGYGVTDAEGASGPKQAAVPIMLERGSVELVFTWADELSEGRIGGLAIRPFRGRPGRPHTPGIEIPYSDADYVDPDSFLERQVAIRRSGEAPLGARLRVPRQRVDARRLAGVVILPARVMAGSDGIVEEARPVRDVAAGLASRGVATIAFGRRTAPGGPGSAIGVYTVRDDLLADAEAAVRLLAGEVPEVDKDRIFLLGFGYGGWLAPAVAERLPRLRGLVLISPPVAFTPAHYYGRLEEMGLIGPGLSGEDAWEVFQGALVQLDQGLLDDGYRLHDTPAGFWKSLDGYEPLGAIRESRRPVLLLFGGRDALRSDADIAAWGALSAGEGQVSHRYFPRLDPWLLPPPEEDPRGFAFPRHVEEEVLGVITEWMGKHRQAPRP